MQLSEHRALTDLILSDRREGGDLFVSGSEEREWQDVSHWASSDCVSFSFPVDFGDAAWIARVATKSSNRSSLSLRVRLLYQYGFYSISVWGPGSVVEGTMGSVIIQGPIQIRGSGR